MGIVYTRISLRALWHTYLCLKSKRHILTWGQCNCTTHLPVLSIVSAYPNPLYPPRYTFINFCALSAAKGMELIMKAADLNVDKMIEFRPEEGKVF